MLNNDFCKMLANMAHTPYQSMTVSQKKAYSVVATPRPSHTRPRGEAAELSASPRTERSTATPVTQRDMQYLRPLNRCRGDPVSRYARRLCNRRVRKGRNERTRVIWRLR
jgi:hypothetical protein